MDSDSLFSVILITVTAILILAFILVYVGQKKNDAKARKDRERKRAMNSLCFEKYIQAVRESGKFPTVATNLILKKEEIAFYNAPSALCETRAVRHYQSGMAGVRVAKGVWIGGSQGRSASTQEWAKIDEGILTITSHRVVFEGNHESRSVSVAKITSTDLWEDAIQLHVEGREKSMLFTADNPLIPNSLLHTIVGAVAEGEVAS